MVAAKKSSAQITQRKFPTRVPTSSTAAIAAPVTLAPADCGGATFASDFGRAVAFITSPASFIFVHLSTIDSPHSLESRRRLPEFLHSQNSQHPRPETRQRPRVLPLFQNVASACAREIRVHVPFRPATSG